MRWIATDAALERMGVKPQTLYAYVSRGRIAARPDADDPRRSLYSAEDIDRLGERKKRGRKAAATAQGSLRFGDPVLSSAIATVHRGRLYYRGRDAAVMARTASLEATARLLWDAPEDENPFADLPRRPTPAGAGGDARVRAFALLARRAADDPPLTGRSDPVLRREAASVMSDLVDALCGVPRSGALHDRLAKTWRAEHRHAEAIRLMLVLVADHELNASTFAARVAASTGAGPAACALAGLSALSGPLHGGMTAQVAGLLADARRWGDPRAAAMDRLGQGQDLPGFGHPLYPDGDVRAHAIAAFLPWNDETTALARAGEAATGRPPNLDFALVAACRTLGLPPDAPFAIFMVGRAAGWLAHALEQRAQGGPIRPRALYIGPEPRPEPQAGSETVAA